MADFETIHYKLIQKYMHSLALTLLKNYWELFYTKPISIKAEINFVLRIRSRNSERNLQICEN